jgi:SPP1 family predicted phage head-tail adaptor
MTRTPRKRYRKRYRVKIQTPTETQDTAGQPVVSWDTFIDSEPAEFIPTNGIESMRGKQLESGTSAIFRVNYRDGYTRQMRIEFKDSYYGITHINPVEGLYRELDLHTKAVMS